MNALSLADAQPVSSAFPFAPLTMDGLAVAIDRHAMVVTHAVQMGRHLEPRVMAEAKLVLDLCRARTDRALALVAGTGAVAA